MNETVTSQTGPQTAAEYRAEVRRILREIASIQERWEGSQQEAERVDAEIKATIARIDTRLAWIQSRLDALGPAL